MSKPRAGSAPAAHGDARARKRSSSPSPVRRTAAAITALMLGAGLALVGVAAPASAHTVKVSGDASCEVDGTFTVVWTVDAKDVPNGKSATVKVVEPEDFAAVELPPVSGNGETTWTQHGVIGDKSKASATFSVAWPDYGPKEFSGSVNLEKECSGDEPIKKIEFCHATGSATNPYVRIETSVNAFLNAGHLNHQDGRDIYPAFTIVKKNQTISVAAQGDQSLLQYEDCTTPAPGQLAIPTVAFADECGADNFELTYDETLTGVVWNKVIADGKVTLTAAPAAGFEFENGEPSIAFGPWNLNQKPCIEPSLQVSLLTGRCVADAPWIFYDIELIDPDAQSTGDAATLVLTDGVNTEKLELGKLADGKLEGKVLWPGASVAADGVTPTGWPGWALVGTTWVQVDDNFAWTRGDIQATIEVNPTVAVALSYPPATPECATGPKGSGSGGSTPAAVGTGLASTGFEGTAIAIVAGVIVVAGIAFLVIARIRRNRA